MPRKPPYPRDVRDVSRVIVRVGEAFVYTETITGEPADAERAERALKYILR
jgi:tetracycline repressor-like protein